MIPVATGGSRGSPYTQIPYTLTSIITLLRQNFNHGIHIFFTQYMHLLPSFKWCILYCALQQPGMIGYYLLTHYTMAQFVAFQANFRRNIEDEKTPQVARAA